MTTPQIVMAGDAPRARATDIDTSHAAADRHMSVLRSRYYEAILHLLSIHTGGLTDEELTDQYELLAPSKGWPYEGLDPANVRRRRSDLAGIYGVVEATGRRNRRAVWTIKDNTAVTS